MELLETTGVPMGRKEIAQALALSNEEDIEALRRRLRAMERDGQVIFNRRGGYGLAHKMHLIKGRIIGHPDGFGFLKPEDGSDDLYINARDMRTVLHGDVVMVRVAEIDRRGRRVAKLVEILERANDEIVGRLFIEGGVGFVAPDNKRLSQDILIEKDNLNGATHGQIVNVEILQQPTFAHQALGKVVEILGDHMAPGLEIDIAIRSHDIPNSWPPEVEEECQHYTPEVKDADKQNRVDIRQLPLVTIDGEDSRDFDDAVYCERTNKGWRVIVAIADVSFYVQDDSALDLEARERGNSVYFPERVIPMLPEVLSNGLCSLNPHIDRLCMVCEMQISERGTIQGYEFYNGVMHSHARMTYTQVGAILDGDEELRQKYSALLPQFLELHALYNAMRKQRSQRGAIDFETTETRIIFGEGNKIDRIVPVIRNDAHKIIEECMITANVATADYLLKNKIPALYRVHDGPKAEKLESLRTFLVEFGLKLQGGDKPQAKDYAKILSTMGDRPDQHLIQTVMLRSLQQAVYSPDNLGHFGLAYDAYAHFTSPIRRYPDLLVHRAIKHILSGQPVSAFTYKLPDMLMFGEHCSMTERRADEATRDATDWLKCEYMLERVGEEYNGTVSSVTGFGLFIELDDIYVEGLVHITNLKNDYYDFDPIKHVLAGESTNTVYRLGDRVRVLVTGVSLEERKIDFEMVELVSHQLGKVHGDMVNRPSRSRSGKKRSGKKKTAKAKNTNTNSSTNTRSKKSANSSKKQSKKKTGNGSKKKPGKKKTARTKRRP